MHPPPAQGEAQGKESIRDEITLWVTNLSNHITAERAMNSLKRAKVKHPSEFRKVCGVCGVCVCACACGVLTGMWTSRRRWRKRYSRCWSGTGSGCRSAASCTRCSTTAPSTAPSSPPWPTCDPLRARAPGPSPSPATPASPKRHPLALASAARSFTISPLFGVPPHHTLTLLHLLYLNLLFTQTLHHPFPTPNKERKRKRKTKQRKEKENQVGGKTVGEVREAFGIRSTQRSKRWWILD